MRCTEVGGRMTREDKYLIACLFAVNRLVEKGSTVCATQVDGKWEEIPWSEVIEWINKQYGIEREV